jgi:hypothetical protein
MKTPVLRNQGVRLKVNGGHFSSFELLKLGTHGGQAEPAGLHSPSLVERAHKQVRWKRYPSVRILQDYRPNCSPVGIGGVVIRRQPLKNPELIPRFYFVTSASLGYTYCALGFSWTPNCGENE